MIDNITSGYKRFRDWIYIPSIQPGIPFQTGLFWATMIVAVLLVCALIVAVATHVVYKCGFYGKNHFHTKHDVRQLLGGKCAGTIISTEPPEWTRYCDISRTSVVNGDNVTEQVVLDIGKMLSKTHEGSKFSVGSLTTRETSYLAVRRTTDDEDSSVICVICATPVTLKVTAKGQTERIPIYILECLPDVKCTYTSMEFQICLATLVYFQQSNTPHANVSILRTRGLIWNLVPLCVFEENTYVIDKTLDYRFTSGSLLRFFVAENATIRSVIEFVDKRNHGFEMTITKELSDVIGLVDSKNLVIVGCSMRDEMIGVLFFMRRPSSIELCGSVFDDSVSGTIALACFSRAIVLANRTFKSSVISVPSLSHNKRLIDMISSKPRETVTRVLYLRNYMTVKTYDPERCLVLA